jgi:hypothetical protein
VNLVVDQMRQLEHVDVADADLLLELLTGHAVVERGLAIVRQSSRLQLSLDLTLGRTVEDRRREVESEAACGPAEVRFEDLTDVHA